MNNAHQPRPEFVRHLAWQVKTTIRRENRFSQRPGRRRAWEKLRVSALVLISILVGVGGVLAKEEIQEVQAQEVLLARIRTELKTAEAQLELGRSRLQEIERELAEQGQQGRHEALIAAVLSVGEIETTVLKLRLDEEEIQKTGKEPNDEVSAPIVERRDFVTERLHLDAALAEERLSGWKRSTKELEDLVRSLHSTSEEKESLGAALGEARNRLQETRTNVGEAERALRVIRVKLLRRQNYLAGEISASEVKTQVRLEELDAELLFRELLHRIAHERLWELQGSATQARAAEIRRARSEAIRRAQLEALTQDLLLGLTQVEIEMGRSAAQGGGGS